MKEIKRFSDFYWEMKSKIHLECPICDSPVSCVLSPTFNMDKHGKAIFHCTQDGCEFNEMNFRIEAINNG